VGNYVLTIRAGAVCAKGDEITAESYTGKFWDFRYLLCVHAVNIQPS